MALEGSKHQFRLAGFTRIFPSSHPGAPSTPTPIPAEAIALKELEKQGFDWDKKRKEVFADMSPVMRASWCVPLPPGTPLASYEEQKTWPTSVPLEDEAKSEEDRRNLETALRNFALMLFEPVEIDWIQLGMSPNKRTVFRREGEKWSEQLVVP